MATTQTYYGRIRIKNAGHPIEVEIQASSPSAATKIIEAQYGASNITWVQHMASR